MTRRIPFDVGNAEQLVDCDTWSICPSWSGSLLGVSIAEKVAPKISVVSIHLRNFTLLAVDRVPGRVFVPVLYMPHHRFVENDSIVLKIEKLEPVLLSDCEICSAADLRRCIGWIVVS